ncbi:MAG TPA: glycosyltransferase [Thermoanaerobaculia bacterium]|jgi:glycosyltransferase involved in cell wall biosynthesis|nr:glycosyltransferase [Thermoanaerobaculia bacterium]
MTKPQPPAITVLMSVYEPQPGFLREAVSSVLAQTFTDFELLIIEDPSAVLTGTILADMDDSRIRVHRNDVRLGLAESLNVGVALARSALIARLDFDDVCLPQRLERQLAFLSSHPEIDVYGSRINVIDESGRLIGRRNLPLSHDEIAAGLRRTNVVSHPSVMFRKASVEAAGGYEATRVFSEDFDLWCRMVTRGARFAASEEPLILYRFRPGALKFSRIRPTIKSMIEIKTRYFRGRFGVVDRLRLFAERILMLLPQRLVVQLFRWIEYRGLSGGQDREY